MDQIKRKLRHKMNKMVEKMEKELEIRPVDVLDVRMSCSILRPSLIEDVMNSHGLSHSGVDAHLEALQVSLSLSLRDYFSMLLLYYFMWSDALDS
tara:strand:- start:66 stop:350 length:285 start_codon:yes stop_codon:yes gene_type:complete